MSNSPQESGRCPGPGAAIGPVTRRTLIAELGTLGPLGAQLEREVRAWTAYWNEPYDVPHDAVTVIAMLCPELFTRRRARVRAASRH